MNPQAPASFLTIRDMIAIEMAKELIDHNGGNLETYDGDFLGLGEHAQDTVKKAYAYADALIAYSQKKQ